jgi:alpha-glucosidase (family GH31 glycosyl hydrolase)
VWHDFWTHQAYQGPGGITVPAPLGTLPLFVRAGAMIPLGPVKQYDAEPVADELELLVYPQGQSSFSLYDDDGHSNGYLHDDYAVTELSCVADAAGCVCRISPTTGSRSGRSYVFKILTKRSPSRVVIEDAHGATQADPAWWYDGAFLFVRTTGSGSSVRVVW